MCECLKYFFYSSLILNEKHGDTFWLFPLHRIRISFYEVAVFLESHFPNGKIVFESNTLTRFGQKYHL